MNSTISSYALALCCAAILATGCGGSDADDESPAATALSPEERPIAAGGFETGEPKLDGADEESDDGGGDGSETDGS